MIIEIKNGYINTEYINYIEYIDKYNYRVYLNNTTILISGEDFESIKKGYKKMGLWSDKNKSEYVPPPRTTNQDTTGELRNSIKKLI